MDYYAALFVHASADEWVIQAAHHSLASHLATGQGSQPDADRSDHIRALDEARQVLTSPTRRRAYDAQRRQQAGSTSTTPDANLLFAAPLRASLPPGDDWHRACEFHGDLIDWP